MIIIPSGTVIQSEQIVDDPNEDDIHICGACKKHFNDIFNFMRHKTENSCRLKHCKEETSITLPSTSPPNSNAVLSSSSGSTLRSNRAGTKYTRVALVNTEAFTIEKEDILKDVSSSSPVTNVQSPPSSHPPHLLLADLASQRLGLLNQDLPPEDRANGSEINLDDDWDSSWSAAKVLGTFSVSNSLRRLQNQSLLTLKEHENVEELAPDEDNLQEKSRCQEMEAAPMETATDTSVLTISGEKSLATQMHTVVDCQVPERFIGPHGGFLDVEDVEVATLLANHLTNEPALHIYPHTSESYLSYNNLQNHLVIQDSSDNLTFENSGGCEEVPDGNSDEPGTVKSTKVIGNKVSPKVFQQNKPQKPVRNRKVYPCALEGCNFCGISARDLARHVNKHTGERPFKCQECEKTFTRPDKLSAHLRCHSSEEKTYNCNICEFTCRLRNGLVIHMRRHNDERPYKCQICEYKARTKSHLNVHLRKHTGDHPYKCKKCSRAFTTRSDLTRHSRLHSGDKPFACPHCNYSAALQSSLKTHMQLNHIPGVSLVCSKCNAQCQSRKDFRAHVKTHKDDPKHCTKCDFIGSSSIALRNHLRVHLSEKIRSSPFLNGKKGSSRTQQKKRNPSKKQRKEEDDEDIPEVHNCPYCNTSFWREDALEQHIGQHQLEELSAVRAPAPQDPVLADSADSRDSTDSTSMDATCGLADLAALASEQQLLYRYIAGSHSSSEGHDDNDDLRNAEILASLNQSSGGLPQYVTIQTEQGTLVDTLNCIQYVLPSPLGTLDDNDNDDNATTLLC